MAEERTDRHIELNAVVKIAGWAPSGGKAKLLIRSGAIQLNGVAETRNKKKVFAGDRVSYGDQKFLVSDDLFL
ncbi:MAG: RNA-binding S4 domain-containing protein [Nanoarchaeota archaeon]